MLGMLSARPAQIQPDACALRRIGPVYGAASIFMCRQQPLDVFDLKACPVPEKLNLPKLINSLP